MRRPVIIDTSPAGLVRAAEHGRMVVIRNRRARYNFRPFVDSRPEIDRHEKRAKP